MESQDCVRVRLESIENHVGYTQITLHVTSPVHRHSELWFRISGSRQISERAATGAGLIALLMPAMHSGLPIRLTNPVDSELLENVKSKVMPDLAKFNQHLSVVEINAPSMTTLDVPKMSLTPLSGGVDSFFVLLEEGLLSGNDRTRSEIGAFLFANTGNHRGSYELFQSRAKRRKPLAQQLGIPLITVDSNVEEFYPQELNFIRSHTMRNSSVAYVLSDTVGRFFYASTLLNTLAPTKASQLDDIAVADSVLLPALSTTTLAFESRNGTVSRFEKLSAISDIPLVRDNLEVCVSMSLRGNCSKCWKCRRTLAGLDILGSVGQFNRVFNIDRWRKDRQHAWTLLSYQHTPLNEELLDAAARRGFATPPPSVWALAQIVLDKVSHGRLRPLVGRLRAGIQRGKHYVWNSQDRLSIFQEI